MNIIYVCDAIIFNDLDNITTMEKVESDRETPQ